MAKNTEAPFVIGIGGGGSGCEVVGEAASMVREVDGRPVEVHIVSVTTDDGGDTASIRATPIPGVEGRPGQTNFMPAPGDIRRSLAAISENPKAAKELLHRRNVKGRAVGNALIMEAMHETGDFVCAIGAVASRAELGIRPGNKVIPATDHPESGITLWRNGEFYDGEDTIDSLAEYDLSARVQLTEGAELIDPAYQTIARSDIFLLPFGSHDTSIGSFLATPGVDAALQEQERNGGMFGLVSNAKVDSKKVLPATTPHVADELRHLQSYITRPFDLAIYNTSPLQTEPERGLRHDAEGFAGIRAQLIGEPLLSAQSAIYDPNDRLAQLGQRDTVRHDVHTLAVIFHTLVRAHMDGKLSQVDVKPVGAGSR